MIINDFEVTEAQAAVKFRHLFHDCVLTSPQEALIRTEGTAENWQIELSRRMREEPECCGLKIKWRPSMHGGRTWAQPIAIESQIQAVRVQAAIQCKGRAPGSEGGDFETTIQIQGTLGPEPASLMRQVMCTLNAKLNANLQEQAPEERLTTGGWQLVKTIGTETLSGRIRVKLSSKPEVDGLIKAYHGSSIKIGELVATIQISNLAVQALPTCNYVGGALSTVVGGAPGLQQQ